MEDDKGRQDLAKADTPSNTNAYCGETIGDKRKDLGKADTPSNTGTCMWGDSGRQWQTRERPEKADIPSQAHMWRDNRRQKGKTTRQGRQTHHPTQANVWGDNARQCAQWDRRGEKGRRDLGKADRPSNTGTHVGRQ